MNELSQILKAISEGDPRAADQLLPLVYHELRSLAAQKLAHEKPGQTLQPTALVHEAYLRLVGTAESADPSEQKWDGRGHFFAAAAEAMRRILVDNARRKQRPKHGGGRHRVELHEHAVSVQPPDEDILALDEALSKLAAEDAVAAQVVQLHFFAGLSIEEAASTLGISRATAYREWAYARAVLQRSIG